MLVVSNLFEWIGMTALTPWPMMRSSATTVDRSYPADSPTSTRIVSPMVAAQPFISATPSGTTLTERGKCCILTSRSSIVAWIESGQTYRYRSHNRCCYGCHPSSGRDNSVYCQIPEPDAREEQGGRVTPLDKATY